MDYKEISRLALIMKETGLTVLELEENGVSLHLERKRQSSTPVPVAASASAFPFAAIPSPVASAPAAAPAVETLQEGSYVLSPTVGVFYTSSSPDSKPYVQVGDTVKKGDILCIIEAMKLMNEIPADVDGTIAEICVGNGQVVEYNQPLFRIV